MRVAGNGQGGPQLVDELQVVAVVLVGVAADVRYEHLYPLALEEEKGLGGKARCPTVDIAEDGPGGPLLRQVIQQLDAADIASVPNFVNIGKDGIQLIVPKAVGIRYKSYSNQCYM